MSHEERTRCAGADWCWRCCRCSVAVRGGRSENEATLLFAGKEARQLVPTSPSVVAAVAGRPGGGSHDFVPGGKRGRLQTTATKTEKDELARERHRLGEQGYDRQRADVHRLRQPRMSRAAQGNESHPDVGTAVLAEGTSHPVSGVERAPSQVDWRGAIPRWLEGTRNAVVGPG